MQLHFTPRTPIDVQLCIDTFVDFTYEWNAEFGCFIFDEDEESMDQLESTLQRLLESADINGYFECE